ncbi:MAG TPA: DUF4242 domain-containing protein [Cyclobacteriaceae bacterium]|nr:DUF4242 domain-containing protein [Cyclobacteriaceae bacterium]
MKKVSFISLLLPVMLLGSCVSNQRKSAITSKTDDPSGKKYLYMDVHNLEPGKVDLEAVAGAHQKDLATEGKYGVHFVKYWVDEAQGKVYCLAESRDSAAIYYTHREAHGLVPDHILRVTSGAEGFKRLNEPMFFDIHRIGSGKVNADAVAGAHEKDLAVQSKYHTNFINYWVDEKDGIVMCVAQAPDSAAMVKTHQEAHGLLPDEVHLVHEGK